MKDKNLTTFQKFLLWASDSFGLWFFSIIFLIFGSSFCLPILVVAEKFSPSAFNSFLLVSIGFVSLAAILGLLRYYPRITKRIRQVSSCGKRFVKVDQNDRVVAIARKVYVRKGERVFEVDAAKDWDRFYYCLEENEPSTWEWRFFPEVNIEFTEGNKLFVYSFHVNVRYLFSGEINWQNLYENVYSKGFDSVSNFLENKASEKLEALRPLLETFAKRLHENKATHNAVNEEFNKAAFGAGLTLGPRLSNFSRLTFFAYVSKQEFFV